MFFKDCEGAGSAGSCRILGSCRRGPLFASLSVVGRFEPHVEPALKQMQSNTLAAGFTADGSVENFKRRRQTELKHGRMARCKS